MTKKKPATTKLISNKRARYDYALETELIAGIALDGRETKSLRLGHGHIRGSYVTLKDGEIWLINATITGFSGAKIESADQTRPRKLLLNKREIAQLTGAKEQGRTILPLEVLTNGRYIKVKIAVGKGKKQYDKRQTIKRRDTERQADIQLKNR